MIPPLPAATDTLVVGGGISGLTAAFLLRRQGVDVLLLDAADRPGGVISTHAADGWLFEQGPNSVMGGLPAFDDLIRLAGLAPRRLEAAPAARRRYVVRGGRAIALPSGPASLLRPGLISPGGLLRAMAEPFVPRRDSPEEETVAAFVRRRLGSEVLDYMVGPFVSGVYAGDPERMSIRHAIPRIHSLETEHGGLVRGALARRKGPVPARQIISFPDGLCELPAALAAGLGAAWRPGVAVQAVTRNGDRFQVTARRSGEQADESVSARRVVLAVSAPIAGRLVAGLPDTAPHAATLTTVPAGPVAVLGLGYRRADVAHSLDGFGVLVPRVEGKRILGCLFTSALFPHRAPAGHVALAVFVGGAMDPDGAALPDDELLQVIRRDLHPLLGISAEPVRVELRRWPDGIPQYNLGHQRFLDAAAALEARHPGLHLAGNWRSGVAVGDCVRTSTELAERLRAG